VAIRFAHGPRVGILRRSRPGRDEGHLHQMTFCNLLQAPQKRLPPLGHHRLSARVTDEIAFLQHILAKATTGRTSARHRILQPRQQFGGLVSECSHL
jgi:hypothetical protein